MAGTIPHEYGQQSTEKTAFTRMVSTAPFCLSFRLRIMELRFAGEPCFEERVFYRLLSGFHASITLSICEHFHDPITRENGPNTDCYYYRLGQFTDRLKNIYFTFLFLLRATQHASSFLSKYHYNTGDVAEDSLVSKNINDLLGVPLLQGCVPTFNESEMFRTDVTGNLKKQFRAKFRNIRCIASCWYLFAGVGLTRLD